MVLFLLGDRQPALPEVLAAMQGYPPCMAANKIRVSWVLRPQSMDYPA